VLSACLPPFEGSAANGLGKLENVGGRTSEPASTAVAGSHLVERSWISYRAHARMESQEKIRRQWVLFSALIELGFFCLLRPGEIFRLKHCDVAMPSGLTLCEQHAAIKIASPKNRRQFGESQFVLLCNRNTIGWLKTIHIPHSEQLIWDRSPRVFALLMKQVMRELGVANCKFTPASLRPGGATMYYSRGISISTLRFMGRWSVERSLEHYIQQAMAAQIMNALSTKAVNRLKLLSPHCLAQSCWIIWKRPILNCRS